MSDNNQENHISLRSKRKGRTPSSTTESLAKEPETNLIQEDLKNIEIVAASTDEEEEVLNTTTNPSSKPLNNKKKSNKTQATSTDSDNNE